MTSSHPLFDAYIFVDWSAKNGLSSKIPTRDTIWVGHLLRDGTIHQSEQYCRSREVAIQYVFELLQTHLTQERRVLVGFDFPYCYPKGLAEALNLTADSTAWKSIWQTLDARIADDAMNESNRFTVADELNQLISPSTPGPFWGAPVSDTVSITPSFLRTKSPFPYQIETKTPLPEFRLTETTLRQRGLQVQETWKLFGNGSVGSQALLGIPRLNWLRFHDDLAAHSRVWPFETGFTSSFATHGENDIIHAEIWPGIISKKEIEQATRQGEIRDQVQVRLMCKWAADLDIAGQLSPHFDLPQGLNPSYVTQVVNEEGWILGTSLIAGAD